MKSTLNMYANICVLSFNSNDYFKSHPLDLAQ